ncbi:fimbria/pilus outer membrane usher protein [Yersinia pekkanenii]|uniref:Outer membrane usher protein n=1 Tax=Yersinia pekkanenii TaxID=1288385 RepID=A0A0T9NZP2_9GAMM|nr:fimbria/pilus outer membrane usher protein [Yersinia pekkanenii]CNH38187.1 putative outer membrane usher protein [Yersinia pekkanenii]CRY65170.1 putative outer membrane usher protein [Yersinia pekkanenii]
MLSDYTYYQKRERPKYLSLLPLVIFSLAGMLFSLSSAAEDPEYVEFSDSFLRFSVDATRYSEGNPVAPGERSIDIYLNEQWIGRQDMRFALPSSESKVASPCYDLKLFDEWGIDATKVSPDILKQLESTGVCSPLSSFLASGNAIFDENIQRLDIQVPQAYLIRQARGYVNPKYWDDGVTAATLKYDYTGYRSNQNDASSQTYQYLGLLGGLNWQSWRLYYRSSLNRSDSQGFDYQNLATYVERAVPSLYSRMTLGDSNTDGQVFDSLSYRGIELASDDRMYADSQRGYAPVVRGIARTNARVVVRQQGQSIYETTVPPGPFTIDDLYPTGQGGNLNVTITEADGSEQSFIVPFASIAELLRPGTTRYSLMAGEYRDNSMVEKPTLFMGTVRHGLSNLITGNGGVVAAEGYLSASAGLAFNTSVGALAFNVTQAQTRLPGESDQNGQSMGVTYAKSLPETNTSLTIASYHYSSDGFYTPSEAMRMRDYLQHGEVNNRVINPSWPNDVTRYDDSFKYRRRNQAQISITQGLPAGYGSFYANANAQDYWGEHSRDMNFQLGYNNNYKSLSYNVALNRLRNMSSGDWDNQLSVSFSLPLGSKSGSPRLSSSYANARGSSSIQTGVSGSAGEDNQFNYGVSAANNRSDDNGRYNTVSVNGNWMAPKATIGGSYSKSNDYDQASANVSGGVVAYRGGVVFASSLGETLGIIEAPDAAGASVANYPGVSLDSRGRAVVPYLSPYRQNDVELDPKGLSSDVEFKTTSQRVAPTAGAVALMKFDTSTGYSMLLTGHRADNTPLPFGAEVTDARGNSVGYIAQGGQAMVRVQEQAGNLRVIWGEGVGESCGFAYKLPGGTLAQGEFRQLEVICK